MNKILLATLFSFIAFTSFSQINYEAGYIVDNSGNRTQVLIKNVDWRNTPSTIEYKISESAVTKSASVRELQEFGIGKSLKYTRQTVHLDQSSDNPKNLSRTKNPEFEEETVFLKVLLEGKASLFQYTDDSKNRFLFSAEGKPLEQLVFKQYQSSTGTQRGKNNHFRQQLLNNFSCLGMESNDVSNLKYSEKELRNFFIEYNECSDSGSFIYQTKEAKGGVNFKIKAGVDLIDLNIEKEKVYYQVGRYIEFEKDINPRFGFEVEYILPFNKNKWAVFTDPSYQQFSVNGILSYYRSISYDKTSVEIRSKSVAIPVGLRHYIFLGDKSGLFLNVAYAFNYYIDNELTSTSRQIREEVEFTNKSHSLDLGVGYHYKNTYSIEAKYGSGRDIFSDYSLWKSGGTSVWSVILGYKIF